MNVLLDVAGDLLLLMVVYLQGRRLDKLSEALPAGIHELRVHANSNALGIERAVAAEVSRVIAALPRKRKSRKAPPAAPAAAGDPSAVIQ